MTSIVLGQCVKATAIAVFSQISLLSILRCRIFSVDRSWNVYLCFSSIYMLYACIVHSSGGDSPLLSLAPSHFHTPLLNRQTDRDRQRQTETDTQRRRQADGQRGARHMILKNN